MSKNTHLAGIVLKGRPWTTNRALRSHWKTSASHTQIIRHQARLLWQADLGPRRKGQTLPKGLTVHVQVRTRDKILQDVGACQPTVKAAIDGLVDTGWITDDDPHWIRQLTFYQPLHNPGGQNDTFIYITA